MRMQNGLSGDDGECRTKASVLGDEQKHVLMMFSILRLRVRDSSEMRLFCLNVHAAEVEPCLGIRAKGKLPGLRYAVGDWTEIIQWRG
jgi:hypothetical protein